MQDNQQSGIRDANKIRPEADKSANETTKQPATTDNISTEEEGARQKEEWQRGISTGKHEEMNATDDGSNDSSNPNRSGSSSIPLEKNDTMGNP